MYLPNLLSVYFKIMKLLSINGTLSQIQIILTIDDFKLMSICSLREIDLHARFADNKYQTSYDLI